MEVAYTQEEYEFGLEYLDTNDTKTLERGLVPTHQEDAVDSLPVRETYHNAFLLVL